MFAKRVLILLILLMLIICPAHADGFYPSAVASVGYSQTQWLSNGNSRALLVCDAVRDLCDTGAASFGTMSAVITSANSYIREGNGLDVYVTDGSGCLCIHINFGSSAENASAFRCGVDEIGSGIGSWYTVDPSDCRVILAG